MLCKGVLSMYDDRCMRRTARGCAVPNDARTSWRLWGAAKALSSPVHASRQCQMQCEHLDF